MFVLGSCLSLLWPSLTQLMARGWLCLGEGSVVPISSNFPALADALVEPFGQNWTDSVLSNSVGHVEAVFLCLKLKLN